MSSAQDERREAFARYKEDVQRDGKPFYPYAMFHDTVMSLVVVGVIVALSCIWYLTSGEDPEEVGVLGPRYSAEADPGTTSFTPRPDWYFYFLFYLLRIFKWPDSVILGTVGFPTILMILLFALPFLDVRRERRIIRRPVAVTALLLTAASMGVLTYKGATAEEATAAGSEAVERLIEEQNLPEEAAPGLELFLKTCTSCHTYAGEGSSNLGAPDLTSIGATGRSVEKFMQILREGPGAMPSFASMPEEDMRNVYTFLEASK